MWEEEERREHLRELPSPVETSFGSQFFSPLCPPSKWVCVRGRVNNSRAQNAVDHCERKLQYIERVTTIFIKE